MREYRDENTGIYLRPITYGDTDNIIRWRNTDFVRKNFIYQELFTKETHENWMKTQVETGRVVQTIICGFSDDRPYGSVYIRDIDQKNKKAEYGIFIGEPDALGKGMGTSACRLMLNYCFGEAGLHKVYLRALAGNLRAIRSYEKAGFVREGYLKDEVFLDGKYTDVVWMAAYSAEAELWEVG